MARLVSRTKRRNRIAGTIRVKLAPNALIARAKLAGYLLEWRPENDKAKFLGTAGYTIAHADQLMADIRTQLLPLEAIFEETTDYGKKYRISGTLIGPNGRRLLVESIWMVEAASGATKFITLYPTKGV